MVSAKQFAYAISSPQSLTDAQWWCNEVFEMHVFKLSMGLDNLKFIKWCQCYKTIIGLWLACICWAMDAHGKLFRNARSLIEPQKVTHAFLLCLNLSHASIAQQTHSNHEPIIIANYCARSTRRWNFPPVDWSEIIILVSKKFTCTQGQKKIALVQRVTWRRW